MRRQDLEVGMEVHIRLPRGLEERAVILDLTPGWSKIGPRRPWTAFTHPDDGWMRPKHVDGTKVEGLVRWGDRFLIGSKRNQNVAVAIEIRSRVDGSNSTVHKHWEPAVIPLSQLLEPWATFEARKAEQDAADAERNKALYARRDERKAKWEKDIGPVLHRVLPDSHSFIDRLGTDYAELRPMELRLHQVPAHLIEKLAERIVELEEEIDSMGCSQ